MTPFAVVFEDKGAGFDVAQRARIFEGSRVKAREGPFGRIECVEKWRVATELLSNLVFEYCWSCGDLVGVCGFNSVFERDACDDFREVVKAA